MKALRDLTHELAIDQAIRAIDSRTTLRIALSHDDGQYDREQLKTMLQYGYLHEVEGIKLYRSVLNGHDEDREGAIDAFRTAYACWRALAFLPRGEGAADPAHPGFQLIEQELAEEGLSPVLNLAFHLGIAGLLGERNAEVRLDLSHFRLDPSSDLGDRWRDGLLQRICCAFLLLVRKDGGWSDIDQALEYVQQLRQEQKRGEARYLEQQPEERRPWVAVELLALYHALRLISLVGSYLLGKEPGSQRLRLRLDRHHSEAVTLLLRCQLVPLAHLVDLLWLGCHALVQNALWTHPEQTASPAPAVAPGWDGPNPGDGSDLVSAGSSADTEERHG